MRDVTQGRLLLILSVLTMIAYFYALFLVDPKAEFLGISIRQWALIIPVLIVVYLFLFVVAWIGWAMATTPPSISLSKEEPSQEEGEEEGSEENEEG